MRYAVVDTGSNTIRMSVYEYESNKLSELFTDVVFANLAGHIVDNKLTDEGIAACCNAIAYHKETAKKYDATMYVFATAAIRNAKNAIEITQDIKKNTGIKLHILSGTDEGELSFLGAFSDFTIDTGVMADVGGGSSEIIAFKSGKIVAIQSIPLGSLKAYKTFVKDAIPTENEVQSIKEEIKKHLDKNEKFRDLKADTLCLVGGGVRAAKKLSEAFLDTQDLTISNVDKMLLSLVEEKEMYTVLEKLVPERALTIAPSLAIYSSIGDYFGAEKIQISDKGIKEGYVLKYLVH